MNWDALQRAARTKGYLVFAMDQAQTPVLTQPGPWGSAYDGYCIGLAATWIAWQYDGKAFPVDGSKVCDYPPWQASKAQNFSDAIKRVQWSDGWKAAVGEFQMTPSDGLRAKRDKAATGAFVRSIVSLAYGCYGISIRGSGGAHAIAVRHGRDGRFHLFDSNYGQLAVQGPDAFKTMFDWYWSQTSYPGSMETFCGVVGIKPPINKGG